MFFGDETFLVLEGKELLDVANQFIIKFLTGSLGLAQSGK
jgi:hypothetical protein